jgi:hypothetical protein
MCAINGARQMVKSEIHSGKVIHWLLYLSGRTTYTIEGMLRREKVVGCQLQQLSRCSLACLNYKAEELFSELSAVPDLHLGAS